MENQNDSMSSGASQKSASEINQRMTIASQRADQYLAKNGFTTTQRHGQRISVIKGYPYKDEPWTEVFIGKIPRDMFEDEIMPALERVGRIYKIRLMMDFSGTTRGFGYVKYMTPQEASTACDIFHEVILREGCPPSIVLLSFDNKRLYFGNLPIDANKESIRKELSKVVEGVVDVELPEVSPSNKFRHANVTFKTHDAATQARRLLVPSVVSILGRVIKVDWAIPVQAKPKQKSTIIQSPPFKLAQNADSILGDRAKQMLADESIVDDGSRRNWDEVPKSILVANVNPIYASRLRKIFELGGQFRVNRIYPHGFSSFIITYENPYEAALMLDALLLMPDCFNKIAVSNQALLAQYYV